MWDLKQTLMHVDTDEPMAGTSVSGSDWWKLRDQEKHHCPSHWCMWLSIFPCSREIFIGGRGVSLLHNAIPEAGVLLVILTPAIHPTWLLKCPSQCREAGRQQQGQAAPSAPLGKHACYSFARLQPLAPTTTSDEGSFVCSSSLTLGCSLGGFHCPGTQVPGSMHSASDLLPRQRPPRSPHASGRQLQKEKAKYMLASETAA